MEANKMDIIYKRVDELIPYVNNPRDNKNAIDKVASSIKNFGFKVPIVVDKNNEIITGHTRLLASKKLGIEEVPVIVASDLSEAQVKAFRIADNKVSEYAEWDEDLLKIEMEALNDLNFNLEDTGFELNDLKDLDLFNTNEEAEVEEKDDKYTHEINIPQYEIRGEKPELDDLINTEKTNALIDEIKASGLEEDEKNFLIESAKRHTVFNYQGIAEYYAHASEEMQDLMEKSALVIVDLDNAIRDGYVRLNQAILDMVGEE